MWLDLMSARYLAPPLLSLLPLQLLMADQAEVLGLQGTGPACQRGGRGRSLAGLASCAGPPQVAWRCVRGLARLLGGAAVLLV